MIVVAAVGAAGDDDALELGGAELAGPELVAGPLDDAGPLAAVAAAGEDGAAELLAEEVVTAGAAELLDWLAVPWEQAVSNANNAAVPVSRVERDRRFTGCPFGGSASLPAMDVPGESANAGKQRKMLRRGYLMPVWARPVMMWRWASR